MLAMTTISDSLVKEKHILNSSKSMADDEEKMDVFPKGDDLYLGSDISEAGSECPELEMDSEPVASTSSSHSSLPSDTAALQPDNDDERSVRALAAAKALLSQFIVEQEYHGHNHTATPALTPNGSSWIINGFAFSRLGLQPGKLLLNPAPLDTPSNTPAAATPVMSMLKPEVRKSVNKSSSLFLRLQ